ncbi:MAG TPA: hypothetical protein VGP19_01910 [Candidatus Acidoferrales bacterium]|jgi:hypothetical protein|nr:hypothetical protein [Candidatus Acidoferrales bacterium]
MRKQYVAPIILAIAALALSIAVRAQTSAPQQPAQEKTHRASPAPRRDLSGIWDVVDRMEGIAPAGVKSHAPFTAFGANIANNVYKPGDGPRKVPIGLVNDPLDSCDPAGFPRNLLFELRPFQLVQTPNQVLMLYQYQQVWRVIWKDGRGLPKDPDPRWYGYSVGKWADDYTFVVETVGMDERTWLDNAGDPHSSDLRVEERYHRIDRDTMELTVTIDDPKVYTEPWLARDKLRLTLLPANTDTMEMICAPTEAEEYKKTMATPLSK